MKGPGRYGPLTGKSAAKAIPARQEGATNASAIRYFTAIPRPRSRAILGQQLRLAVTDLSQLSQKNPGHPPREKRSLPGANRPPPLEAPVGSDGGATRAGASPPLGRQVSAG